MPGGGPILLRHPACSARPSPIDGARRAFPDGASASFHINSAEKAIPVPRELARQVFALPRWGAAALVWAGALLAGCTTLGGGAASIGLPVVSGPSEVQATIIAQMKGGLIGGPIGEDLSDDEKARALEAEYRALEYTPAGQKVAWSGESLARRGEVVAAQPYRVGAQDCRQYKQTVFTEEGSQTGRGAACRNPDGSWTPLI